MHAKLVQISPISTVFVGDISIVDGVYKPTFTSLGGTTLYLLNYSVYVYDYIFDSVYISYFALVYMIILYIYIIVYMTLYITIVYGVILYLLYIV